MRDFQRGRRARLRRLPPAGLLLLMVAFPFRRHAVAAAAFLVWGLTLAGVAGATRVAGAFGAAGSFRAGPSDTVAQGQVGSATCAKCHASIHQRWSGARHSKMLQPATAATIVGRFADGTVELRGT